MIRCAIYGCAAASARRRWKSSPTPTLSARSASTGGRLYGRCAASTGSATRTICRCSRAGPARETEPDARLPPMPLGAHVVEDYRRLSLSLKAHPTSFMRARLSARGILRSDALAKVKNGERVTVAGLVLVRQRPGTAKGVIFMTLEDETGIANVIVWPKAFERLRAIVLGARFVAVTGKLQSESGRHPYRRRAHERSDADAGASVGGGPDDRRPRPRRRGPPAATDDGAKTPGQPLRPAPAARRPARARRACRSKRPTPAQAMPAGRNFR